MYERNGEKYFIVDAHTHFWDASPPNWVKGQEQYAKGWIECFHAYMGLGPPETHWPLEKFMKYSEDDYVKDVFEDGGADHAILPVHVPEGVVHDGLQHGGGERQARGQASREADRQRTLGSARGRGWAEAARGGRQDLQPEGRQGLHGRVVQGLTGMDARRRGVQAVLREAQGAGDQEHPRPQGTDDLAARQGRVRRQGH